MIQKAIVMLSGGMDSAVALAEAVKKFGKDQVYAITFDYGQRHEKEMHAAYQLAKHFEVKHTEFKIDLRQIGGSSLTDSKIDVPDIESDIRPSEVALTYVPMRNTIFLSLCAAYAEVLGCQHIYTGFNWIDSGGYPDTTNPFVQVFNVLLTLGSRDQPKVIAPLIEMTKAQIVQRGQELNVPWNLTWSCYKGLPHPCGSCNACVQRKKGFDEAHVVDPLWAEKMRIEADSIPLEDLETEAEERV